MLPVCDQTVTIYRKEDGKVLRWVVKGCYFQYESAQSWEAYGENRQRPFQLILRPCCKRPQFGDRILPGIGPEEVVWEEFLPCTTEDLVEVAYVIPWYWDGQLHHVEAGRK